MKTYLSVEPYCRNSTMSCGGCAALRSCSTATPGYAVLESAQNGYFSGNRKNRTGPPRRMPVLLGKLLVQCACMPLALMEGKASGPARNLISAFAASGFFAFALTAAEKRT